MCKTKILFFLSIFILFFSVINYFIVTKSAHFSTDVTKGEAELTAEMLQT
jgi:hypothetical protein